MVDRGTDVRASRTLFTYAALDFLVTCFELIPSSGSSASRPRETSRPSATLIVTGAPMARRDSSAATACTRCSTLVESRQAVTLESGILRDIVGAFLLPQAQPLAGCGLLVAAALAWVPHLPFAVSVVWSVSADCHCVLGSACLRGWLVTRIRARSLLLATTRSACVRC